MRDERHLICTTCETTPTVARLDGVVSIVCHCSHVDGVLDPVPLEEFRPETMPTAWEWAEQGEEFLL